MSRRAEVVRYAVEGGYANLQRSVVVYDDGTLEVTRGGVHRTGAWPVERVRSLAADLKAVGLFTEDRELAAPKGAADLQRYEIRFAGATLVAHDTTLPARLAAVVARLDEALASA